MADYYTPTVVDPVIPIGAILPLERMFLSEVFDEQVKNGIAYFYSEDGARDLIYLDPAEVRAALEATDQASSRLAVKLREDCADEIAGDEEFELDLCGDLWEGVLQDIVRRAPDLDHLTVTIAFTCSKMRPDGFGGLAMLITADTIRSDSTHTLFDRFYTAAQAKREISRGNS